MNDNLPDEKEYKKYNYKLTPFKLCVLQNFPFIEADFDAITNYQLLCKVVEYLNHVIDNQNTVEDNFKIMADNLNTLYNYIDTLDLQDEVNNKLDEMADSGELTEIISLYLNTKAIFAFNNVNELKQANNLVNGSNVKTLGFYNINDGGGAYYIITDNNEIEANDATIIGLNNGLKAVLLDKKIDARQLGCLGNGEYDNYNKIIIGLNYVSEIIFNDGTYYSSQTIPLKSNIKISGNGTIASNVEIQGTLGNQVEYSNISQNKIDSNHTFNIGDLILVEYKDNTDNNLNKRQVVKVSSSTGKLSNDLCNYGNNYNVTLINNISNIEIDNVTINGNLFIKYSSNILINNINLNGNLKISSCYDIKVLNSHYVFGNNERADVYSGSSNIIISNNNFLGGNSNADNSALKLNEVFYSKIDACNFSNPNNEISGYNGTFHAIMVDGNFAEDDFPNNPSQYINISNCFSARGYMGGTYFIALAKNVNLNNMQGYNFHIKKSDNININNSSIIDLNNESDNTNININNTTISNVITGSRSNIKYNNCKIDNFRLATGVHDVYLTNCIIDKFNNSNVQENSAYNIFIKNCEIINLCDIGGINKGIIDIVSHCRININRLYNTILNLLIIDNVTASSLNISMQNSWHNKVFYHIVPSAVASGGVSFTSADSNTNKIETITLTTSNNPNNAISQSILKNSSVPTSETEQHYRGEIIYNTQPTAGGYIGWICVASGKPGTWKGFGLIET